MVNVLFLGSSWTTNLGNSFVALGAVNLLRAALGNAGRVHHFGTMSSYLFWINDRPENNFNIAHYGRFDYVVIAGMVQNAPVYLCFEDSFRKFLKNGAKLIVLGGGAMRYDAAEAQAVRALMAKTPLHAFASRDRFTFEQFGDLAPQAYDGIDCAFFVGDGFCPVPFQAGAYNAVCIDRYQEPLLLNLADTGDVYAGTKRARRPAKFGLKRRLRHAIRRAVAKPRDPLLPPPVASLDMEGRAVVRTHHTTWSEDLRPEFFQSPQCMISDLPSDYLSVYAQAHTVYSDRVHACIAALAFGRRAMWLRPGEPRIAMFARVGAPDILDRPVRLDAGRLAEEKRRQVDFVRAALGLAAPAGQPS